MNFENAVKICAAILTSLGGAAAIIFGLSNYLGKMWADRALEQKKQEYTKLNIEFSNQLDLATRRLQIELDALGHLHKLRTQAEFEKLQELWKHVTAVRGSFHALPRAGFAYLPADKEKQKEFNLGASKKFVELFHDAQQFVNEQALSIPKHIADAANKVLWIANSEIPQVMMYPDPFDSDAMRYLGGEISRQFYDDRNKRLKEYGVEADNLELTMREYLQGQRREQPRTEPSTK